MPLADFLEKHPVHELHLSHNSIGLEGAVLLLSAIACGRDSEGDPIYPLKTDGPGARPHPIWLRLEYNCIDSGGGDPFTKQAEDHVRRLRAERGWLTPGASAERVICSV